MASIRFFTDEDVYGAIAAQLQSAGFDAVSLQMSVDSAHWTSVSWRGLLKKRAL